MGSGRCILETSVLVNALLKQSWRRIDCEDALSRFREKVVPHYVLKEFKAGGVAQFVWVHNYYVLENGSIPGMLRRILRRNRQPKTMTGMIEFVSLYMDEMENPNIPQSLGLKEGGNRGTMFRFDELQMRIFSAWADRKNLASDGVGWSLECYPEDDIEFDEKTGMIEMRRTQCPGEKSARCSMRSHVRTRSTNAGKVKDALRGDEKWRKERKCLKDALSGSPAFSEKQCRGLGDVGIFLLAERGDTILTENLRDFRHLCAQLPGRVAKSPSEVLG